MALTSVIATPELARIADLCYEGYRARVSLANLASQGYTSSSTVANWDSIKISGNGYADFTDIIETGAYDSTDQRYEMGGVAGANQYIDAVFEATGLGYSYNNVYVVLGKPDGVGGYIDELYLHSLLTESPSITLAPGSTITYRIQFAVDD
jgi:hypothetical protein